MSGLGNRVAARLRGQKAQAAETAGKHAVTPDVRAAAKVTNPDAIYAAALTGLASELAAGRLDTDLAAAAARSLARGYREKHLANSADVADRSRTAVQAESAAYRIREELVGSGQNGAEDSLLSSLDAAVCELRHLLTAVRRQGERANRHNNGRLIQDQRLPGGWERSVAESTARIQAIMNRMNELAQAHAKAVRIFEAARDQPPSASMT